MLETGGHSQALNERLRALSRRERGLLLFALALSITAHVAGWFVIDASLRYQPEVPEYWLPIPLGPVAEVMPPALEPLPDIDDVLLDVLPAPLESAPVEITPVRVPDATPVAPPVNVGIQEGVTGGAGQSGVSGGQAGGDPSTHARLEYRMGSVADVWKPAPRVPVPTLTDEEIMRARVAGRLGAYNDSLAIEAAAKKRAEDWTVKDAEGGRWGLSPKGVHLGDVTIPLPNFAFAPPPGAGRPEFLGRVQTFNEIQGQASRYEASQVTKDRARAIRERIDRERARTRNETIKKPPADTGKTGDH